MEENPYNCRVLLCNHTQMRGPQLRRQQIRYTHSRVRKRLKMLALAKRRQVVYRHI
jgi:hypothetical protein